MGLGKVKSSPFFTEAVPSFSERIELAAGNMPGYEFVHVEGKNPDIDTGSTPEDIWPNGGLYVPPTQARVHDIASTSAEDSGTVVSSGTITEASLTKIIDSSADFSGDGVAVGDIVLNDNTQDHSLVTGVGDTFLEVLPMHHGDINSVGENYRIVTADGTGAVVAHIKEGLDSNFDIKSEFVVLNGTSDVETTNSYTRINLMHIHGAGSNKSNVGDITATAQTDSTVTAIIKADEGESRNAFYSVPRGYDAYVEIHGHLNRSTSSTMELSLFQSLWAGLLTGSDGQKELGIFSGSSASPLVHPLASPLKITEYSDVWLRCTYISANNSIVTAGFDITLKKKE